jgi:hypothetical protein
MLDSDLLVRTARQQYCDPSYYPMMSLDFGVRSLFIQPQASCS